MSVFTVTKYKIDGSKQSTRKYSYDKTRNLILQDFGFEVKSDADTNYESEKIESAEMQDIDNDTELLSDTDFEDDIEYEFTDME